MIFGMEKRQLKELQDAIWPKVDTLEGWCGRDRCDKLVELVLDYTPHTIVEVGVFGGRSLAALALALATEHRGGARVWGIDPWTNESNLEGEPNEHRKYWEEIDLDGVYFRFIEAMEDLGVDYRHIRARGEQCLHLFKDGSIDLLSLDGNHSELSSCRDVQLWLPKLAVDGHLVMDDTGWASMQKAVGMVREAGLTVTHYTDHWMVFRR